MPSCSIDTDPDSDSDINIDTLYAALLDRDSAWDGRAWVGVTSTGVFCRLSCPARKPKRENCRFFSSIEACLAAGFRPCLRCRPLQGQADADPVVQRLLGELEAAPGRRWSEAALTAFGIDPSTARRAFKRHFGISFLEYARQTRLRHGARALRAGESVIAAQLEAGFDSASGFRAAFARFLGLAPGSLRENATLLADWIDTPLGPMVAVADRERLHLLEFHDRKALSKELATLHRRSPDGIGFGRPPPIDRIAAELHAYFSGRSACFATPLAVHGSDFSRAVWRELQAIPAGETRSYRDVAERLGRPRAVRAVARANGANQIAIAIPCHRVIAADGSLSGYGGGRWRKQRLIELERGYAEAGAGADAGAGAGAGADAARAPAPPRTSARVDPV